VGDLYRHASQDHANDAMARNILNDIEKGIIESLGDVQDHWKGVTGVIREILYDNLEFQAICSDEIYYVIDPNSQEVDVIPIPSKAVINAYAIYS
jgi:hypothetical protein